MKIALAHVEPSTALLGPGDRFCVWVHGCKRGCPGCVAEQMNKGEPVLTDAAALAAAFLQSRSGGITLTGGEPFDQPTALVSFLRAAKAQRDAGVIAYSGYTLQEIERDANKAKLLNYIDILIDGGYIAEYDDGRAYVGSSNQIVHYITNRYAVSGPKYYSAPGRRAEIRLTPGGAALIGVPSKDALAVWNSLKERLKGGNTGK